MVRVVLTYGPTSPRLRADLSSLTSRLVSVRVVWYPREYILVSCNTSFFFLLFYNVHYVIKFVSDLPQVSGFLWILRFPPPIN